MSETRGVSIVIVNYNNEQFLAAAIDSALAQEHPFCETIVVDDCSTDNSRMVIARYGDRVRSVLREKNGGQTAALNSAWPFARYPILMFLDSDDVLLPHATAAVAARWTTAIVKIQFPLVTIDKEGRQLGHVAPTYPPNLNTATLRIELLRTGGSPNSPASGNAYSRSLLEIVTRDRGFELENLREHWMDAILECNAPFYGEVVTLYEPLACYRIHGGNLYAINSIDAAHYKKLLHTFDVKLDYFARRCQTWGITFNPVEVRARSQWALECEFILSKLGPSTWTEQRRTVKSLYALMKSYLTGPMPLSQRILRIAWFFTVLVCPRFIASQLIALRFVASERPAYFQRLLNLAKMFRFFELRLQERRDHLGAPVPYR
jgi:glycosyltransferase involved in cell wall biosynthesis